MKQNTINRIWVASLAIAAIMIFVLSYIGAVNKVKEERRQAIEEKYSESSQIAVMTYIPGI